MQMQIQMQIQIQEGVVITEITGALLFFSGARIQFNAEHQSIPVLSMGSLLQLCPSSAIYSSWQRERWWQYCWRRWWQYCWRRWWQWEQWKRLWRKWPTMEMIRQTSDLSSFPFPPKLLLHRANAANDANGDDDEDDAFDDHHGENFQHTHKICTFLKN